MKTDWRISTFNGALLACYFIPSWSIIAFQFMVSPVHGLFDQPSISLALYAGDHLHLNTPSIIRLAWLVAFARLTAVAFFAFFLVLIARPPIRRAGGCDEALSIALGIGSVISFASMLMAAQVGETGALHLHAAELLIMLGTAIVMAVELPASSAETAETTAPAWQPEGALQGFGSSHNA